MRELLIVRNNTGRSIAHHVSSIVTSWKTIAQYHKQSSGIDSIYRIFSSLQGSFGCSCSCFPPLHHLTPSNDSSALNSCNFAISKMPYKCNHTVCDHSRKTFFTLRKILWRIIRVVLFINSLFIFIAEYSTVWMF